MYEEIYNHSNEQSAQNIKNIIRNYICNEWTGITDNFFYQTYQIGVSHEQNTNEIPVQGYKFHISAQTLQDYERLLTSIVPEFVQKGVMFKVVDANSFEQQMRSVQAGKAITVYPSAGFDFNNFSDTVKSVLGEQGFQVSGDENIYGRIYARYGRFEKGSVITTPDGELLYDPKTQGQSRPPFEYDTQQSDILTFFSRSYQKLQNSIQNGVPDYKTYFQEKYTMTECDGRHHAYIAFNIPDGQKVFIKQAVRNKENYPNQQSFIKNVNGIDTIFVHKSELGMFCHDMQQNLHLKMFMGENHYDTVLSRPEWDIKQETMLIPNASYDMAKNNLSQFINTNVFQANGKCYLKCDTCFVKEIQQECDKLGIPYQEYNAKQEKKIQKQLDKAYEKNTIKKSLLDKVREAFPNRPKDYIIEPAEKEQTALEYFKSKLYNHQTPQTQEETDMLNTLLSLPEQVQNEIAYEYKMVDLERMDRGLYPLNTIECATSLPYVAKAGISIGAIGLKSDINEMINMINNGLDYQSRRGDPMREFSEYAGAVNSWNALKHLREQNFTPNIKTSHAEELHNDQMDYAEER